MTKETSDQFEPQEININDEIAGQESLPVEQQLAFTTGQTLANARTAAGLALEDLAEELRIPLKVLEGIEQDEWPNNLPETFVRGYIRAYAKRVNVPESDVLTSVDSTAASSPTSMHMHSFSKRSKRKKIERRLIIISWIIGAVIILALALWYFQTSTANNVAPLADTNGNNALEVPVATPSNGLVIDEANVSETGNGSKPLDSDQSVGADTNQQTSATRELNGDMASLDSAQVNNSKVQNTVESESESQVASQSTQQQASMSLSDEQLKVVAQSGDGDDENYMVVEFKFENDCWVEVYDGFDERIAIGNKPAGYLMTLNAQGPFNVLLGNPAGVSIWVNGEPYDLSHMPTNRVARFEIDEQP